MRTAGSEYAKDKGALGRSAFCRVRAAGFALLLLGLMPLSAWADGGSKTDPDLQVGGFAVFGTNVTGATSVTSGWGSVYMQGSLQVQSNLHVNGAIHSTNLLQTGRQGFTQRDQWLAQYGIIQPVSSYIRIRGDGQAVLLGNPQIAPGTPGQLLTLQGVSSTWKVTVVDGHGLRTKMAQPFSLGEFDTMQFIFDDSSSTWVEINRSQNRWDN